MPSTIDGVDSLIARLNAIGDPRLGQDILRQIGDRTVLNAKTAVPRKTGNLGRSIQIIEATDEEVTVAAQASYARAVEEGTQPHTITPRAKKALRWAATASKRRLSGRPAKRARVRWAFAKWVRHPGTGPRPYLIPGARKALDDTDIGEAVVEVWNRAG